MKVIIAAGGRGTRIRSVASDIPKPLIRIEGVPVLEREIVLLRDQGFTDIILTVGYKHELIEEYFGDGSSLGVGIEYYVEENPIGNAGALFKLRDRLTEDFLFLIGDALFDIDFSRFIAAHRKKGGLVTLFTHPNSHPYDSSLIVADENGSVLQWLTKEDIRPKYYQNRVNAGLHIISPKVLDICGIDGEKIGSERDGSIIKADLDRDLLRPLCGSGKMFCYDSPEYCRDMGTPERYSSVSMDVFKGIPARKNLKNKQKAVFLDRDGTINKHIGFLTNTDELQLLDGAAEAIKKINQSEFLAVVVTNQPVIARGEVTFEGLREIHNKMETLLGNEGAYLDGIYFCPHHPHKGFDGEVSELKTECDCRKPKPGLLLMAAENFNIDLESSWMIGDGERDIGAGKNAGCKTALIGEGELGQDMTGSSLLELVNRLIE